MSESFRLGKVMQFLFPCVAVMTMALERELKAQSKDARVSGLLAELVPQAVGHQSAIGIKSTEITQNRAYQYRKNAAKLVENGKSVRECKEIVANNLAARKKSESGQEFSPLSPNTSILKASNSCLEGEDWSCTIKVVTDRDSTCERGAGTQISQAVAIDQKPPNQQRNNIQQTIDKIKTNANPRWGTANQPGFFVNLDQTGSWSFPSTGSNWGTGAGRGVTSLTIGANGSVNGNSPNMFNWSAQFGPIFEHVYNVPSIDRTALAIGIYGSLNPLRHFRNGFNIYTNWSGIYGLDQEGSSRFQNIVQAGMLYSFANVNIIPDPFQRINIPEKGFYLRIQPTWLFRLDGQLSQSRTQAYLGWAENHYPFSMAIEVGPEFIQASGRDLQTIIGSFFDLGYYFTPKIRAYLRYRPALSFGGSDYPAAPQLGAAGIAVRF